MPPLLRTAATRQPRSCSAAVTSAAKLECRAKPPLRDGPDDALSTSTTLQPLTGKKVVLHRRCGGKCPPPNELAITREWASLNYYYFLRLFSPLVALIAQLGKNNYMKNILSNTYAHSLNLMLFLCYLKLSLIFASLTQFHPYSMAIY